MNYMYHTTRNMSTVHLLLCTTRVYNLSNEIARCQTIFKKQKKKAFFIGLFVKNSCAIQPRVDLQ